jgi:hypothetical protein
VAAGRTPSQSGERFTHSLVLQSFCYLPATVSAEKLLATAEKPLNMKLSNSQTRHDENRTVFHMGISGIRKKSTFDSGPAVLILLRPQAIVKNC